MNKRNGQVSGDGGYVSYGDALSWQQDFAASYRCTVEWKLTIRKEKDGSLGLYVTAFIKERAQGGGRLLGHQVVRFGKQQDAATLPAAMIRALILLDRDLGGMLDEDEEDTSTTDPAVPLT